MPIKKKVPPGRLRPRPRVNPNTAAGEGRTIPHQAFNIFRPKVFYEVHQRATQVSVSPDLPIQTLWGFDGVVPGPTYVAEYGEPVLVRNFNDLPPLGQNGGFGLPSVTTHLHNGHTPSESDGGPCMFFERGQWYDQHYPNVLAGILSTHPGHGDINEAMSTLWYHDHRVDFTAQSTYKGLVGFYLLFNEFDTGKENKGFHLPNFPEYDIPLVFADKVFDEDGILFFDLFNLDGIIGDTFTVNGVVQPFFEVEPRRYRFRLLDVGPSRFFDFFLTDLDDLNKHNPFWVIANDGNLLPKPVQVENVRIGVAERVDVIIDFREFRGKSVYLENRVLQVDGRGPTGTILPAGQGNLLMRFDVSSRPVHDRSVDPDTMPSFYALPDTTAQPRIVRTFKFDRLNGQWSINGQFVSCEDNRVRIKKNSVEHWVLQNLSGDWQHPIHIHLEEHQILSRQRLPVDPVERGRKDVTRLTENEVVNLFFRFRDFTGTYPLHCHNTVHEDHAMMLLWEVVEEGEDNNIVP
ncbi:MAG: multicopper oxidase domain-containing protein [Blastocatellia bacterium]|nr:multicopper oxidase domain-containing protein [Blastocatellia bacterium]